MKGNNAMQGGTPGARAARMSEPDARSVSATLEASLEVGATIEFGPTGERLRITSIDDGEITFEKLP